MIYGYRCIAYFANSWLDIVRNARVCEFNVPGSDSCYCHLPNSVEFRVGCKVEEITNGFVEYMCVFHADARIVLAMILCVC